jgi:hypothetical protein
VHAEAYAFVESFARSRGPFGRVVEIGGRDVNGSVRPLFGAAIYTSVDVREGPGVDVVADAAHWDPPGVIGRPWAGVDCVVCCEVLEHASNAPELVAAAQRWLRTGGLFVMTCATYPRAPHSAVNGELMTPPLPEFYRNVSPGDFEHWCRGFASCETSVDPRRGDLYAVAVR